MNDLKNPISHLSPPMVSNPGSLHETMNVSPFLSPSSPSTALMVSKRSKGISLAKKTPFLRIFEKFDDIGTYAAKLRQKWRKSKKKKGKIDKQASRQISAKKTVRKPHPFKTLL